MCRIIRQRHVLCLPPPRGDFPWWAPISLTLEYQQGPHFPRSNLTRFVLFFFYFTHLPDQTVRAPADGVRQLQGELHDGAGERQGRQRQSTCIREIIISHTNHRGGWPGPAEAGHAGKLDSGEEGGGSLRESCPSWEIWNSVARWSRLVQIGTEIIFHQKIKYLFPRSSRNSCRNIEK